VFHEVLSKLYPDYWWVDPVRLFVVFVGAACFVEMLIVFKKHWRRLLISRRITLTAFGLMGAFAAVQELDQIGQKFLIWRLPALVVISCLSAVSLWMHLRGESTIPN
jgi:uncharacterized membrane protein YeiH